MATVIELLPTGECLVGPVGELDLATAPDLVAEFEFAMEHVSKNLLIDLSQVTFIDSSGLAALVRARLTAEKTGGSLVLTGADQAITELLQLTRLDQFFDIRTSGPAEDAGSTNP
jgi:anti-sigma B factor antagonist